MKHGLLIKYLNFLSDHNSSIFPCNNSPWKILILRSNFFWNLRSNNSNSPTILLIFVRLACHFHILCAGCRVLSRLGFLNYLCRNFRPLNSEFYGVCLRLSFLLESKIKPSFFFQYCLSILLILFDYFFRLLFYFLISNRLWISVENFDVVDPINF